MRFVSIPGDGFSSVVSHKAFSLLIENRSLDKKTPTPNRIGVGTVRKGGVLFDSPEEASGRKGAGSELVIVLLPVDLDLGHAVFELRLELD